MYPGTDHPTSTEEYETFAELKEVVEEASEGLNQVISWSFVEMDEYSEEDERPSFSVLLFMPRKSRTWEVTWQNAEPTDELKLWIEHYLRPRAVSYFKVGWKGGGER